MAEEIRAYYAGRRRLAKMMGCDPATFTDKDVAVSALAWLEGVGRGRGEKVVILCSYRSRFGICCHQLFRLKMRDLS